MYDDMNEDLHYDKYFQGMSNNAYYEVTYAEHDLYKDNWIKSGNDIKWISNRSLTTDKFDDII